MSEAGANAQADVQAGGGGRGVGETAATWQPAIDRARRALADDDDAALIALDEDLGALLSGLRRDVRRGLPHLVLYRSLVTWKRDGQFVLPFDDQQTAKVQIWELDEYCPDTEYKRQFVDHAVARYPDGRGFKLFQRILSTITNTARKRFIPERTDVQVHRRPGATMTIVGFSGINGQYAGIGWPMFARAVAEPLNANLIVLRDYHKRIYLAGIESLGDYATSVAKIREIVAEFADTRVVATGGSGGVFGAINFAADLGIRHIVAMAGPTSIELGEQSSDRQVYRQITADIDAGRIARVDLPAKVNDSAIERIDFFVAGKQDFDMAQLDSLRSRCAKVQPHIYEELTGHIVTDYAIADGTMVAAFRAGPDVHGLA